MFEEGSFVTLGLSSVVTRNGCFANMEVLGCLGVWLQWTDALNDRGDKGKLSWCLGVSRC
ncbi:hypothetical protein A2U01_0049732 [Trifolium medium]|uniref:Uncharacterized protein n=1 Tax=Trifolium medium TaxID=97028 RepID=A0A392QVZ1_9FABA|nr:hypothetical protein [Trifolium medium]